MDTQILFSEKNILNNIHCSVMDRQPPLRIIPAEGDEQDCFSAHLFDTKTGHSIVDIVYRNENPLSCGARLWIETRQPCRIYDREGGLVASTDNSKRIVRIHINKNRLKQNNKRVREDKFCTTADLPPVITCKDGSVANFYGYCVEILSNDGDIIMTLEYQPFESNKIRVMSKSEMIKNFKIIEN